ncbi:MAG: bacteriohemerythrin [Spirochaetaceae bacterium]|jgi:hemerythrin|nr:bacteriohemerythrin [Spirochaetaceae bacterium]
MAKNNLVEWSDRYRIGIPLIDEQHKKLIDMTNTLYTGCLEGDRAARIYFLKTIHDAVDYVRFHFSTEEKLLERIKYPDLAAHKKEHEDFAREIISQVQAFQMGKAFVPNVFVRYLRDWVLTHIAVSDKLYAAYLLELKKQGVLFNLAIKAEYAAMRIRRWLGRAPVYGRDP